MEYPVAGCSGRVALAQPEIGSYPTGDVLQLQLHWLLSLGPQYLPCDGHIIERYHPAADGLSFFVSFAGQKHQITLPRLSDGQFDGVMTIWLDDDRGRSVAQPGEHLVDDRQRVFSPRIIRGEDHHITARASRAAHQRTFAAITIAAAAEHGDHPAASLGSRTRAPRR